MESSRRSYNLKKMIASIGILQAAAAAGVDADAQTYFTNTGYSDVAGQGYIDTFVKEVKNIGVWTKRKAIYLIMGTTAALTKWNLKDPRDLDVAYRLTWNGPPTFTANGFAAGYGVANMIPNSVLNKDAKSMSIYVRTNSATDWADIGCVDNPVGDNDGLNAKNAAGNLIAYLSGGSYGGYSEANSNSQGFWMISRSNSSQINIYKNGAAFGTNPKTYASGSAQNTTSLLFGHLFSDRQWCFFDVGDDLTATEVLNYSSAVNALQTSLGRNVY
jgi:hypothetical protein